jgi:hypothetical protein
MALPTIFDICVPRDDVLKGSIVESEFAADLAQVIKGDAPDEIGKPSDFFANTHPTAGLKTLLKNVCQRIGGQGGAVSAIFRLDTQYGGGKTHSLIALNHAAAGLQGVSNVAEFLDANLVPKKPVRVAAFDGENADPASGREMEKGLRAYTPWGEIAYRLGNKAGYEAIKENDRKGIAPGAENIRALFGDEPALILLDELALYLRAVKGQAVAEQLPRFLTNLFKAVEGTKNAALVFTLAVGKEGRAHDAYSAEHQFIADKMAEAESVAARKATIIDPTAEDEAALVVCRRLFKAIDGNQAKQVAEAYQTLWTDPQVRDVIAPPRSDEKRFERLRDAYPLHPELMATLTDKLSTLGTFQRVRGMLRLLARTVEQLWNERPPHTYAIHLHHIDPAFGPIQQEIITRLHLNQFEPAIRRDVSAPPGGTAALAQELDQVHYKGMLPYGSMVARPILMHTLAFNESLKGLTEKELRYSVLAPEVDLSFVDDARKRFQQASAHLDDKPNVPLRLLAEANLTQIISRQEQLIDSNEVRAVLKDRIQTIFKGDGMKIEPFRADPGEVPDDTGDGKPYLVVVGYEAASVTAKEVRVPQLVSRIMRFRGSSNKDLRKNINNLVFIVADEGRIESMRQKTVYRLALEQLRTKDRLGELADYQREQVQERYRKSEQELALAIQQCYRHVFYPSRHRVEGSDVDLAHTAIDTEKASEAPGTGQRQVVSQLQELNKLRLESDEPDSPQYVRDRTPLKKGSITTGELRAEFRRDPALPMLRGDDLLRKVILNGVGNGDFVYQSGDLLFGPGDPPPAIHIDEQSFVFTMDYAKEQGIWPRKKAEPKGDSKGEKEVAGGDDTPPEPEPEPPSDLSVEAALKEALTRIWEQAKQHKISVLAQLRIRPSVPSDGFTLVNASNSVQKAEKRVTIEAQYKTQADGTTSLTFDGTADDAKPVIEFLRSELRAAKDQHVVIVCTLTFREGFTLEGDEPRKLADRLSQFSPGTAYVEARAFTE